MIRIILILFLLAILTSCRSDIKNTLAIDESHPISEGRSGTDVDIQKDFTVYPISHATMVLIWDGNTIYVDPVGGASAFDGYPSPDLILITDIHGDHLNIETLLAVSTDKVKIIVPQAVADKLPSVFDAQVDVLYNGNFKERFGFSIQAIAMYNLKEEALQFHTKGRGNGYVIEKDGKRVYISGDTEDIPEMRSLRDIDIAFVCMNLPYTMTELQAAQAVVDFKPKIVYPYHYRGKEGFSDIEIFKDYVKKSYVGDEIQVIELDWYSDNK
jgi:L-ascorbate metabolism protein UlaG (beta-lactamase superfamily)